MQYCDAAAQKLEQIILEIRGKTDSFCEDCQKTAENLRLIGQMEKERTSAFYATVKGALDTVAAARKTFDDYMSSVKKIETVGIAAVEASIIESCPNEDAGA